MPPGQGFAGFCSSASAIAIAADDLRVPSGELSSTTISSKSPKVCISTDSIVAEVISGWNRDKRIPPVCYLHAFAEPQDVCSVSTCRGSIRAIAGPCSPLHTRADVAGQGLTGFAMPNQATCQHDPDSESLPRVSRLRRAGALFARRCSSSAPCAKARNSLMRDSSVFAVSPNDASMRNFVRANAAGRTQEGCRRLRHRCPRGSWVGRSLCLTTICAVLNAAGGNRCSTIHMY